jgi:hypothetical protein
MRSRLSERGTAFQGPQMALSLSVSAALEPVTGDLSSPELSMYRKKSLPSPDLTHPGSTERFRSFKPIAMHDHAHFPPNEIDHSLRLHIYYLER